jgi:predicted DNA-binding protein with PD1-like motif
MKSKIIAGARKGTLEANERTFAIIFDTGDEVIAGLKAFAGEQGLAASHFTAIGAFKDALLGYFDWEKKEYEKIPIREQVEVLSLVGDVTLKDGKPSIHAHAVVGKRDGTAHGGHLLEAHVRPTLEVILTESPEHLTRHFDKESGLALIRLEGV